MVFKKSSLGAVVVIATLALTACSSGSDTPSTSSSADGGAPTGDPFNLLMVLSQTGALASSAQAELEGMTAAVENVNDTGGINGRPVELKVVDDKLDPTQAVTLVQEAIDSDTPPDLVWAGMTSNVSLAILPLLGRAGILAGSNTQSDKLNDPATYPLFFSIVSRNDIEAVSAAAKLADDKVKKVALLAANDANGQSVAATYTAALEDEGIAVSTESYAPADLDMTAQLQRLQAGDPDVLLLQGFGGAVGYILKSRTALGWDVRTVATSSVGNGNNLANISTPADWTNLELLVYPINTLERPVSPAFDKLVEGIKAQNSKFDATMQLYAAPWDLLHLVQLAAAQAESEDGVEVAKAMENLDQPSGDKPYVEFPEEKFSSTEHFLILDADDTFIYVKAGELVEGTIQSEE